MIAAKNWLASSVTPGAFDRAHCSLRRAVLLTLSSVCVAASQSSAQVPTDTTRSDVIVGTVTNSSGAPVALAEVVATRAPDRLSLATETDSAGHYQITFTNGTGDYLIHIAKLGFGTVRRRVTRLEGDSLIVGDAILSPSISEAQQLAAVKVLATKPRIQRDPPAEPGTGSADHDLPALLGAIPPMSQGDIGALVSATPGVVPLATGGFSALGLTNADNNISLNGIAFGAASIPRDARTFTRISTSVLDPSKGWFTGATVDVTLAPGGPFTFRRGHVSVDAIPLDNRSLPAPRAGTLGAAQFSLGGDGAFTNTDRYVYSYGIQATQHIDPIVSFSADAAHLAQFTGVPTDVAARFLRELKEKGIPATPVRNSSRRRSTDASFAGRLDAAPYDWKTFAPKNSTWGLLGYAASNRSSPVGTYQNTTRAFGGVDNRINGLLQANFSAYDSLGRLTTFRSGLSGARNSTTPYFRIPSGTVSLAATDSTTTTNVPTLSFGANPSLGGLETQWLWETVAERQFFVDRLAHHLVKLSGDIRIDGWQQEFVPNRWGGFTYQSLEDFETDAPSSFTRSIGNKRETGTVLNSFASVGDYWKADDRLRLLYGLRIEGNRFISRFPNNVGITSVFGLPTNRTPAEISVSPRIGLTWIRRPAGAGLRVTPVGGFTYGPTSYIRVGIGEFRNFVPPTLSAAASMAGSKAGLPRTLQCVGVATPPPMWNQYVNDPESIPDDCETSGSPSFGSNVKDIRLLDPSFRSSRAWRANISYTAELFSFTYTIEGLYSINFRRPGLIDLNFSNTPQFTLANESSRPVYVPSGSIVETSGILSPSDSRLRPEFGRVADGVSDLKSLSQQLSLTLSPNLPSLGSWFWSFNYTLTGIRQLQRGFDGSTFGSPVKREWATGDLSAKHQFLLQGGVGSSDVSFAVFGRVHSGLPYTPVVSGDINGDGFVNDRAFIFDPNAGSITLGSLLQGFLRNSPARIRNCLTPQLGRPAARNSCFGPWVSSVNAQLSVAGRAVHLGKRATVALSILNVPGWLDALAHGSAHLRGWGEPPVIDPVLYNVRGFDSSSQTYRYSLNERFGQEPLSGRGAWNPFHLALDLSFNLGPSIPAQQLQKALSPGRHGRAGPRFTSGEIKARYARNVPNPYEQILSESDSLLLSQAQTVSLLGADSSYTTRVDSIWTELADYLVLLGDDYDAQEAVGRANAATDEVWELSRADIQKTLPNILSPAQLRMMPVAGLYISRGPIKGRTYRY